MESAQKLQSILIIGGGLGGLTLAQGLTAAGFKVTVFERDQDPISRTQGYRISIRSMGLSALKALLPKELFERPDRGIGGSNVFEDARILTSLLASNKVEGNLAKVIGEYERLMFARAKKEVELSNKAAKIHHLRGFWRTGLRNQVLKLIGMITSVFSK